VSNVSSSRVRSNTDTTSMWYGLLFELSGSRLPAVVAHATWNALAMWQELGGGGAGLS
jgi:hypothetical protein